MSSICMPDGTIHDFAHAPDAKLHDSDYFSGWCPCNDYPCKWSVMGQSYIEAAERRRGKLLKLYFEHHKTWPQGAFIDAILQAEDETMAERQPHAYALQHPNDSWCHVCKLHKEQTWHSTEPDHV